MDGKSQQIGIDIEAEAFAEWRYQARSAILLIIGLLATPFIILLGIGYGVCFGIRAGAIAGAEKTLNMLRSWGE